MRRAFCWLLPFGLLLALTTACGGSLDEGDAGWDPDGDILPPDSWDPGDRPHGCGDGGDGGCAQEGQDSGPTDHCRDSPCVFGTCREAAEGYRCDCDAGYAGELCDACASGHHLDGMRCVPDTP